MSTLLLIMPGEEQVDFNLHKAENFLLMIVFHFPHRQKRELLENRRESIDHAVGRRNIILGTILPYCKHIAFGKARQIKAAHYCGALRAADRPRPSCLMRSGSHATRSPASSASMPFDSSSRM